MNKRIAVLSVVTLLLGVALGILSSKRSGARQRSHNDNLVSESDPIGRVAPASAPEREPTESPVLSPKVVAAAPSAPSSISSTTTQRSQWGREVGIERTIGADGLPIPLTDDEEREAQLIIDNNSMQRQWREEFVRQRQDDEWTARMEHDLRRQEKDLLSGNKLTIDDLSCRETICRMYLQFEDQLDADAFKAAQRDPNMKFEFQSLDPTFNGDGFDRSNFMYEVIVRRPRPEGAPAQASQPSEGPTAEPGEGSAAAIAKVSSG